MGIFDKNENRGALSKETTVISQSTKIEGEITLESNLHIDGRVEGTIKSSSVVSVGKSGEVQGEIYAAKVLVSGRVNGKIDAKEIEIVTGGRVVGEIFVENLVIQSMGVFSGVSHQKEVEEAKVEEPSQIEFKEES